SSFASRPKPRASLRYGGSETRPTTRPPPPETVSHVDAPLNEHAAPSTSPSRASTFPRQRRAGRPPTWPPVHRITTLAVETERLRLRLRFLARCRRRLGARGRAFCRLGRVSRGSFLVRRRN